MTLNQIALLYFCIGVGWAGYATTLLFTDTKRTTKLQKRIDDSINTYRMSSQRYKKIFTGSFFFIMLLFVLLWPITMVDVIWTRFKSNKNNN